MAKILDFDYRLGSQLENVNKISPTVPYTNKIVKGNYGYELPCQSNVNYYILSPNVDLRNKKILSFTSVLRLTKSLTTDTVPILISTSLSSNADSISLFIEGFSRNLNYVFVRFGSGEYGYKQITSNIHGYHHYTMLYNGNASTNATRLIILIDGVQQTLTFNGTIPSQLGSGDKKYYYNTGSYGNMLYAKIFDHILTPNEIKNDYLDFLNSKPVNKPVILNPNLNVLKPTELQETGLVSAYNFISVNGKYINTAFANPANQNTPSSWDISNLKGCLQRGNYIRPTVNKVPTQNTSTSIGNIYTYLLTGVARSGDYTLVGPNYSTDAIIQYSSSSLRFYIGGSLYVGNPAWLLGFVNDGITPFTLAFVRNITNVKIYVNGKLIINTTVGSQNGVAAGIATTNAQSMGYNDLRTYKRALSEQEVKAYHNQFASKPVLLEDFSQYAVGSTRFGNWKNPSSGSIQEVTKKETLVNIGQKFIASGAGKYNQAINNNTAFGTFEYIYKGTGLPSGFYHALQLTSSGCGLDSTDNKGYALGFVAGTTNVNYTSVWILTTTIKGSSASIIKNISYTFPQNQWVKIKVTIGTNGLISVYIDNNFVGSVINTTYNTSKYSGIFYNGGGNINIANLKIVQGITV